MAILNKRLVAEEKDPQPLIEEVVQPRKSTFTALIPDARINTMLKYVEGSSWSVNYYGQILNENSQVNNMDDRNGDLAQSYVYIRDLTLKVTSTLSYNYDEGTGISKMAGTAIVPYRVKPNPGDVFIANVDTGEDAIFVINQVQRLTQRKDTLYSIEYSLFTYTNDDPEYVSKLKNRTNEEYFYDNYIDSMSKNVLITTKEKNGIDTIRAFLYDSQREYFRLFTQVNSSTLSIPGLDYVAFDPVMVDFLYKTVNMSDIDTLYTYMYHVESPDYNRKSILSSLIECRLPNKGRQSRQYTFLPAENFFRDASLKSFIYAGVDYACHPVDPDRSMQINNPTPATGDLHDIRNDINYNPGERFEVSVLGLDGHEMKPILHTLFDDNYYIVSEEFYKYVDDNANYINISLIELLIYKHLNKQEINVSEIVTIVEDWEDWSRLHQFYLLPVIWLISKKVIGMV